MNTWVPLAFLIFGVARAESRAPDFDVKSGLDPASKVPRWTLQATPPAGHHFNIKAPASAMAAETVFTVVRKLPARIDFASSERRLGEGQAVKVTAFLCDDAKTYCLKKVRSVPLRAEAPVPGRDPRDPHGFFVNDPQAAIAEAKKRGLPLLIDFYGIWCPPCNLYAERLFPSPEFRMLRKRFVLLKLDADREESFELKSRYRVGGYPTWIAVAPTDGTPEGAPHGLPEIGRIVGYYPPKEFLTRVLAFAEGAKSGIEERVARSRRDFLDALKDAIRIALEKKDRDSGMAAAQEALRIAPGDLELGLYRLQLKEQSPEAPTWGPEDEAVIQGLKDLARGKGGLSPDLALRAAYWIIDASERVPSGWISVAGDFLDALEKNLNPASGFMTGTECSVADLEVLRMDRARALRDEAQVSVHRKAAIDAYRQMIAKGARDSRGLHLELAALLSADGKFDEASAIYDRFIKKFPDEFTFYFAAARMFLEKKDFTRARELAEQAVRFAYGDNLIRSMDRLVQVMGAQGEGAFARERGEAFLSTLKLDPELKVRTGRYVSALKKTLAALQTPVNQEKK
jgi:tetratricopeptide (TPR) repeat protein